jgi:hypothetical protein
MMSTPELEIPQGRIIAVDGGGFVRVCPICDEEFSETGTQVEAGGYDELPVTSYTTEVSENAYKAHYQAEHA